MSADWLCCQIGAREHYAIPRALHVTGRLERLFTDSWVDPRRATAAVAGAGLRGRFHRELRDADIASWTWSLAAREIGDRISGRRGWARTMRRNAWFQDRVLGALGSIDAGGEKKRHLFAYSYAAGRLFEFAARRGWRTILGQIDPGPVEERIVAELHRQNPALDPGWTPAPPEYWHLWRRECALADLIVVNSPWARDCLIEAGIAPDRLRIVPLVYEDHGPPYERAYPREFTPLRRMRVLFLGQANLRKGIHLVLEAAHRLEAAAVEFWIVGDPQIRMTESIRGLPNVRWLGPCARNEAAGYYRAADVFVLPTFSDGFALTQLEARRWGLPMIVSQRCGRVVTDGVTGMVLPEPTATALTESLEFCIRNPLRLQEWSAAARAQSVFGLQDLSAALAALE